MKLDNLISELCPNGVVYSPLGALCKIETGKLNANAMNENGIYPFFTCDAKPFRINTYAFDTEAIIISGNGSQVGHINYYNGKFNAYQRTYVLSNFSGVSVSFLLHYLRGYLREHIYVNSRKGSVPYITLPMLREFRIPLPPLAVQQEIVRILDSFTELTAELNKKLTAELTARRKQYEHYRDELLTFGDDVPRKTVQDVCKKIFSGGTPSTKHSEYYGGSIPWLRTQEVDWCDITDTGIKITKDGLKKSSAKWIPKNCVIVAMYGATAAKVAVNKIALTTNQACCNLEIDEAVALYRYVFYWLSNEYTRLKSLGQGSQSNISGEIVKNYPIPVPSIEQQRCIVHTLDRFDAICNDLTSGLPAEIAARQKQYEYYRDKLLTFKELER